MGKYFGTDGVRGAANEDLTADLAYKIGLAASDVLINNRGITRKPKVIIGRDTRISGSMFESAIAAGICAGGSDAVLCGVVPTPAIAYLVKKYGFDAGVMISASHNPAFDNGVKIFNSQGYKLSDELEEKIEYLIDNIREANLKTGGFIGEVITDNKMIEAYIEHVAHVGDGALAVPQSPLPPFISNKFEKGAYKGLKVLIDCANGSASVTAEKIFGVKKVSYSIINSDPNGLNINDKCGSTHLEGLIKRMKTGGFDIGFAFDGDADRCLAVDETGEIIDGDKIICVLAENMMKENKLKNNAVAVTKLSNMGLHKFCGSRGINVEQTDVGDRFVLERMLEKDISIGGEQSGHIIVSDYATTGDGQITAVLVLDILRKSDKTASEIFGAMKQYPQVMINVKVGANDIKEKIMSDKTVLEAVAKIKDLLNGNGRVLLRPSGTEPLIRIMAEGEDQDVITGYVREIESVILGRL